jgi:hypothetical protein
MLRDFKKTGKALIVVVIFVGVLMRTIPDI